MTGTNEGYKFALNLKIVGIRLTGLSILINLSQLFGKIYTFVLTISFRMIHGGVSVSDQCFQIFAMVRIAVVLDANPVTHIMKVQQQIHQNKCWNALLKVQLYVLYSVNPTLDAGHSWAW